MPPTENPWPPLSNAEQLQAELVELKRKTNSSRWILGQAMVKIVMFPRNFMQRMKRSLEKRRGRAAVNAVAEPAPVPETHRNDAEPTFIEVAKKAIAGVAQPAAPPAIFTGHGWANSVAQLGMSEEQAGKDLAQMLAFQRSPEFREIFEDAVLLDPNIASADITVPGHLPPWFEESYYNFAKALDDLPTDPVDTVILVPFGKMGGADYVAGLLSKVLAQGGRTVILRTDKPDWDRPDWYAEDAVTVDLSDSLSKITNKPRALYCLLQHLKPRAIYNVNSRLCFEMLRVFGRRLSDQSDLYAYYFCSDYTAAGHEAGYPVWYISDILPHLRAAICDTTYLRDRLIERYQMPPETASLLRTIYTPFAETAPDTPFVSRQLASSKNRDRPVILWAGRLDRQKRFDLVQKIARLMPDVDFLAWGKAVLDAPPKLEKLPTNLKLNEPFTSYDALPLLECDGWLYTAEWDGLPTILIEIAGMGVPIVASAVGGVPELISEKTGWLVREAGKPEAYVQAIREMLANPDNRCERALAAQALVHERHSIDTYRDALSNGRDYP